MAGKQGYNTAKGKQGFQPVYNGAPSTISVPQKPDAIVAAQVHQMNYGGAFDPQEYLAENKPPQSYIDAYGWQDAFLQQSKFITLEDLQKRYGSETVVSAYSDKINRDLNSASFKQHYSRDPLPYRMIGEDMNALCRTIIADDSGRYSPAVKASAQRVHSGYLGPDKLNASMIDVYDEEGLPYGEKRMGFSRDAGFVLHSVSRRPGSLTERAAGHVQEFEGKAQEHKEFMSNPNGKRTPSGFSSERAPKPDDMLVNARKKALSLQKEFQSAYAESRDNKNPFARGKKEKAVEAKMEEMRAHSNLLMSLEKQGF